MFATSAGSTNGKLWAEGRLTLQLNQQRLTPRAAAYLTTSVVLPPDNEVVAPVSIRSALGIRPGPCSMVETLYGFDRRIWGDSGTHTG